MYSTIIRGIRRAGLFSTHKQMSTLRRSKLDDAGMKHEKQHIISIIRQALAPVKKYYEHIRPTFVAKLNLSGAIIEEAFEHAFDKRHAKSDLYQLISAIPKHLTYKQKQSWLAEKIAIHSAGPVLTPHPVDPYSIEAEHLLKETIRLLTIPKFYEDIALNYEAGLQIRTFAMRKSVPDENLTPVDEANRALTSLIDMLSCYPVFADDVINQFVEVHGGDVAEVRNNLLPAIKLSFQFISDWSLADFDGNPNRDKQSLETTVPAQQKAILKLYIKKIDHLIKSKFLSNDEQIICKIEDMRAYFKRCYASIDQGIWFNVNGHQEAKNRTLTVLADVIDQLERKPHHPDRQEGMKQLNHLKDLVDFAGFFGGLKEYTRQSTQLNQRVLNELYVLLKKAFPLDFHQYKASCFSNLGQKRRLEFIELLRKDAQYFSHLKGKLPEFSEETQKELQRLYFVTQNSDIFFKYICSDTVDKVNFDEVLILSNLAMFCYGQLHIGDVRQYPFNPMALCETPKDIGNAKRIFGAMMRDPAIRRIFGLTKTFSFVAGPSDLGTEGGLMMYFKLIEAMIQAEQTLSRYKRLYPKELKSVTLRVLLGNGGDYKRAFTSAACESHCTFQGLNVLYGLLLGGYDAYLHNVVGHKSESAMRVAELKQLKLNHPDAYKMLKQMIHHTEQAYSTFIQSPENKILLSKLTHFDLEKAANVSSRPRAKSNLDDPTNIRAIGLVNLYLLTGVSWDIFMSFLGLLSDDFDPKMMRVLYRESTTMKDVVMKVWYAIAVSQFDLAWEKINFGKIPTSSEILSWHHAFKASSKVANPFEAKTMPPKYTLAHIQASSTLILLKTADFLSEECSSRVKNVILLNPTMPPNLLALDIMHTLSDDPLIATLAQQTKGLIYQHRLLSDALKIHQKEKNNESTELCVLALRGLVGPAMGPKVIQQLRSPLHQKELRMDSASNSNEQCSDDHIDDECTMPSQMKF